MRQEPRIPQKIYSNEDARKIDLAAMKKEGINSYLLMHKDYQFSYKVQK